MRLRSSHLVLVLPALEQLHQRGLRHKVVQVAHRPKARLAVLRRKARARVLRRRPQRVSLEKGPRLQKASLVKVAPVVRNLLKVGLSPRMVALVVPRQRAAQAAPRRKVMEKDLLPHPPRVRAKDLPHPLRVMAKDHLLLQKVRARDHLHPQRVKAKDHRPRVSLVKAAKVARPRKVRAKVLRPRAALVAPHREAVELLHPHRRSNQRQGGTLESRAPSGIKSGEDVQTSRHGIHSVAVFLFPLAGIYQGTN